MSIHEGHDSMFLFKFFIDGLPQVGAYWRPIYELIDFRINFDLMEIKVKAFLLYAFDELWLIFEQEVIAKWGEVYTKLERLRGGILID